MFYRIALLFSVLFIVVFQEVFTLRHPPLIFRYALPHQTQSSYRGLDRPLPSRIGLSPRRLHRKAPSFPWNTKISRDSTISSAQDHSHIPLNLSWREIEEARRSRNIIPTGQPSITSADSLLEGNASSELKLLRPSPRVDEDEEDEEYSSPIVPPYMTDEQREKSANYFQLINSLAPNELISKFTNTTPQFVQEGVRTTLINVLGSLPNFAFDSSLLTTSTKLAALLFQMQVTGYMFKNAEYRMSFTRSLKGLPKIPSGNILKSDNICVDLLSNQTIASGEVVLTSKATGEIVTIDGQELTNMLSKEWLDLRNELVNIRTSRESELKNNLLSYIQALPEKELLLLSSDISEEVLQAIRLLVDAVMDKIKMNDDSRDTIQQSLGQLAQLCMCQLISGYKLRELEALEDGANIID